MTCLGREDSKAVVPEAAGNDEPRVDCRDEAIATRFNLLTEVVPEVSLMLLTVVASVATAATAAATDLLCMMETRHLEYIK